MSQLIYVADDEKNIRNLIKMFLENEGYRVKTFSNGYSVIEALKLQMPDLVILDIMMPGEDGLSICANLRKKSDVPIIIISAKDTPLDRVTGIMAGSDDYLAKPFDTRELLARLRALVRRPADLNEAAHRIACGDLVLDTAQLTLTGPSSTVTLSRRECDLLAAFCRAPGLLRARTVLLGSVWGSAAEIEDCSLDSYIRFIRRRLTAVGSRAVLRTVRGAGYRFLPDGEENAHA